MDQAWRVYYLVQGIVDLEKRSHLVERYCSDFGLTEKEKTKLAERLNKLDARRASNSPVDVRKWESEEVGATNAQKEFLMRAHYRYDLSSMTKGFATRLIAKYKKLTEQPFSELEIDNKVNSYLIEEELSYLGFGEIK